MGVSFDGFSILETVGLLGVAFFLVWMNSVARSGIKHLSFRPRRHWLEAAS